MLAFERLFFPYVLLLCIIRKDIYVNLIFCKAISEKYKANNGFEYDRLIHIVQYTYSECFLC